MFVFHNLSYIGRNQTHAFRSAAQALAMLDHKTTQVPKTHNITVTRQEEKRRNKIRRSLLALFRFAI